MTYKINYKLSVFTNRIDKENSNPNFQNTLLQRPSPNKAAGARPTVISSNALIHASTRNSQVFKAIDRWSLHTC
ncbi:hypothetical protein ZWY2020_008891 [Hordeum vulgare]|nr:hypothetical protein ZWY2020_008891 [Hordeum vulgare]